VTCDGRLFHKRAAATGNTVEGVFVGLYYVCLSVCLSVGGAGTRGEAQRVGGENGANEAGSGSVFLVVASAQDEVQGQEVVPVLIDTQRDRDRHSQTYTQTDTQTYSETDGRG